MNVNGEYAFWDLIAEEAYEPQSQVLKSGTWDVFQDKVKQVYLFGCNEAAKIFIQMFQDKFLFKGVLDNAEARWGTTFEGLPVLAPREVIPTLSAEQDAIVIALRLNADKVAKQLDALGFQHYYSLGVLVAGMEPYATVVKEATECKKNAPLEDIVLMESTNDFDGNSGALYEYLKKRGSSHKFIWIVKEEESKKLLQDAADLALCPRKSIEDLKEYIRYRAVAKWQIWDNYPIRKVRDDQINVFLQHFGMGYKQIANIFNAPEYVDYVLTTNEMVYEMEKDSLLYAPGTKVIYGELPRNDVLFSDEWDELKKITPKEFDKVIMWAPTLRTSRLWNRSDSDIEYPYGISVVYSREDMESLNQYLAERNMLLLVKIHPRQRLDFESAFCSNIIYLDGDTVKQVHSYKLMSQMDAMISDYSSIVFDYMLLDRPIAWALEDIEHYNIEFLMDNPLDYMPGEKLYAMEDLYRFIEQVHKGEDPWKEKRNAVSCACNALPEGKGCEKIAAYLGL